MAAPQIPPRPSRSQNLTAGSATMDMPKVPPRPKRSIERSISPNRDTFARSPLNDPTYIHRGLKPRKEEDVPARPPSVTLPSIGQEGSEYASFDEQAQESSPQQTKNIAGDLPLYAPTASVPGSTARSRIAGVTRTESQQVSMNREKRKSQTLFPDDKSDNPDSNSNLSETSRSRPQSIYKDDEEHGIPVIGIQVPMYPNAGDVQAPTPSPMPPPSSGIGFFNKGDQPRNHSRTKSGREIFHGPPGSYGLHGHGVIPKDEFERKWYEKHPEDYKKERQGEYGPAVPQNRKDYHWVGDDLHKLVHKTSTGVGMGTSREAIGTPDEQIGYMASEEYAQRMASQSRPSSARPPSVHTKTEATPAVESPLRKMSFPADQLRPAVEKGQEQSGESEAEDDVIHIDPPSRRESKVHGGGYDPPTDDLGPHGGNTEEEGGWIEERGHGLPILASDEVALHPEGQYLQPAVSPELERRHGNSEYTINDDGTPEYITGRRSTSRPSSRNRNSRPGSSHLQRVVSPTEQQRTGTPLEGVKEYEPLFPEDEEHKGKPKTAVDMLKRPDLARHHFPSQDVWEDTPDSMMLQTTVETPQAPEEPVTPGDAGPEKVFEKPEDEEHRKKELTKEDQQSFLPEHTKRFAKSGFNKDVLGDMTTRPGMQNRFPSHDIWEDSPEHHHLVTTVSSPQIEDTSEYVDDAPAIEKPQVAAQSAAKEVSPVEKKAPTLPDRAKPQIPPRPAKPAARVSGEKVPTTSTTAGAEAPQPKAKPQVPARPGGSKIAALKAGFLSDLNNKLGMGPQAPKVKEPEPEEKAQEERAPLADARKGRAKGPQRRKPASSPSGATAAEASPAAPKGQTLSIAGPNTVFEIGSDGSVDVPAPRMAAKLKEAIGGKDLLNEPKEESKESKPEPTSSSIAQSVDHAASAVKDSISSALGGDSKKEDEEDSKELKTEDKDSLAVEPNPEASVSGSSIEPEPLSEAASMPVELDKQLSKDSTDQAVQTGQQDVTINNPDGSKEHMTTYLGGRAQAEGSVVVKDGEEQPVGDAGERRIGVEAYGDGGLGANNARRETAEAEGENANVP